MSEFSESFSVRSMQHSKLRLISKKINIQTSTNTSKRAQTPKNRHKQIQTGTNRHKHAKTITNQNKQTQIVTLFSITTLSNNNLYACRPIIFDVLGKHHSLTGALISNCLILQTKSNLLCGIQPL